MKTTSEDGGRYALSKSNSWFHLINFLASLWGTSCRLKWYLNMKSAIECWKERGECWNHWVYLPFGTNISHLPTLLPMAHHIPTVPHEVLLAPTLHQIVTNTLATTPTMHDQAFLLGQTPLLVYPNCPHCLLMVFSRCITNVHILGYWWYTYLSWNLLTVTCLLNKKIFSQMKAQGWKQNYSI